MKTKNLDKVVLIICLLIIRTMTLSAVILKGYTDNAQLFADALSAGDYYLCNTMLNDPAVEINLDSDFNDMLFNHVFRIYNEQRNAEPYYIRNEPLKIAELLMNRGVSISNLTIWSLYPEGWSPQAENLARKIYEENNYDMESWLSTAAIYSSNYYDWLTEEFPDSNAAKPEKNAELLSMQDLSDEELMIQVKRFYDGIHIYECALEETRRRCADSSFSLTEEIYQLYDKIKDNYHMRNKKKDMERILYLAEDKRIIPGLLTHGYRCSYVYSYEYSDKPHREVSYLIKNLDKNLWDAIYNDDAPSLSRDDMEALAELFEPYYSGNIDVVEVISNENIRNVKVSDIAVKYASKYDCYKEYLSSNLPQFEKNLRFGSGYVRYKAISNLSMNDEGQTFLQDYIFKTWDPQIFFKISGSVEFSDTEENREKLKDSFRRWNKRSYCNEQDKVLKIILRQLITWKDDEFLDFIVNASGISREEKAFSLLVSGFEGDNAINILNKYSPFDNRSYYINRYFPYVFHNPDRILVVDDKHYSVLFFKDFYSDKPEESLSLPYSEVLSNIQSVSNYLRKIGPERKLEVSASINKSHSGFLQGVIKIEADTSLNLVVLNQEEKIIGQAVISNGDSVTCWRNFRIYLGNVELSGSEKYLYLRTSSGEELTVPELKLYINI